MRSYLTIGFLTVLIGVFIKQTFASSYSTTVATPRTNLHLQDYAAATARRRSFYEVTPSNSWSLDSRIPMTTNALAKSDAFYLSSGEDENDEEGRGKVKKKFKKLKKFMLPLLLAYKLKFFVLIPVLLGGLILLKGSTALAGFFFALFAAVMGLKNHHH